MDDIKLYVTLKYTINKQNALCQNNDKYIIESFLLFNTALVKHVKIYDIDKFDLTNRTLFSDTTTVIIINESHYDITVITNRPECDIYVSNDKLRNVKMKPKEKKVFMRIMFDPVVWEAN